MSFLELCQRRESTRRYAPDPVDRAAIDRCVEAARLAPSACNSQPWRFVVLEDSPLRQRVADAAFSGLYRMNRFAGAAPVLVVVVTQHSVLPARVGGHLRGVPYRLIDIGIACEHFALAAAEQGLGTCWLGWFNARAVRRLLGLGRARIDILLSLGYPADPQPREKQRLPLDNILTYR